MIVIRLRPGGLCHTPDAACKGQDDRSRFAIARRPADSSVVLDFDLAPAILLRDHVADRFVVIQQQNCILDTLEGIETPSWNPGSLTREKTAWTDAPAQHLLCKPINQHSVSQVFPLS